MRKYLRRNFTDGEMEELVRAATKKRRSPDARLQKLLSRDANKGNTFYAPKKPAGRTRSGRPPLVAEPLLKEARRSAKALAKAVPDDHTFFERLGPVIWPKKATCPYCGGPADKWGADKGKRNPMSYCESCKRVFNTKSMTVFRCSHTQVSKWLYAMQYIARTKGRISARQLHIELDLAYGTAKKLKEEIKEYFTDAQMRQVTEAAAQKKPNLTPARRTQLRKLLQRNPAEIRSQGSHPAKNRQNPPQKKPTAFDRRKP
jgi:RNA polymerase subunit RPABC4/transcription elongation factor Spt4